MLIIAAGALLVSALVVLLVKARSTRWAWLTAGLVTAAVVLTALHLRRVERHAKEINAWFAEECGSLAGQLELEARGYRMWSADSPIGPYGKSPSAVRLSSMEDEYRGALTGRLGLVEMCVPPISRGWNADDCLPLALNGDTVQNVERAASAIRLHQTCDTRTK